MVGRQPKAPAAFTPGEIPGTHFHRLSRPQGTWFCRGYHGKNPPVIPPGIDPGTVQLVTQCLNHYATPGTPFVEIISRNTSLQVVQCCGRMCFRLCVLCTVCCADARCTAHSTHTHTHTHNLKHILPQHCTTCNGVEIKCQLDAT